jgi:hypothetical protein
MILGGAATYITVDSVTHAPQDSFSFLWLIDNFATFFKYQRE